MKDKNEEYKKLLIEKRALEKNIDNQKSTILKLQNLNKEIIKRLQENKRSLEKRFMQKDFKKGFKDEVDNFKNRLKDINKRKGATIKIYNLNTVYVNGKPTQQLSGYREVNKAQYRREMLNKIEKMEEKAKSKGDTKELLSLAKKKKEFSVEYVRDTR